MAWCTRTTRSGRSHTHRASRKKSQLSTQFGHGNYSLYVSRVLKEVVPRSGLAFRTLVLMNTLINGIFERLAMEACNSMYFRRRCTLGPQDVRKAVFELFPARLAKYAVAFGSEAVHRYVHS